MKRLTFEVRSPKDCSVVSLAKVASLIKEVNSISCRIRLDLENDFVVVENVNDTMIDTVIELVNSYYTILSVDIDNIFEVPVETQNLPIIDEGVEGYSTECNGDSPQLAAEVVENSATEDAEESVASEAVEEVAVNQPTILEPQSEDDLIIKKVEFQNEYIENLINKFLRTAYWAMFKMNIPENEIAGFIYTCMSEISMRYTNKECINFSVGDVVDCYYGHHLKGEINGVHVNSIVCNISASGMVYLVPITKMQTDITSDSYLIFNVPEDVIYSNKSYTGGTALLNKAKYVHAQRINEVVGVTTPDFFKKLLHQLASTFDFTDCLDAPAEETTEISFINTANSASEVDNSLNAAEDTTNKVDASDSAVEDTTDEMAENHVETVEVQSPTPKIGAVEAALFEAIGSSLDKLDKSKPIEEQVESFMAEIGMPKTAKLVAQSFTVACDIKKINYENIISQLHSLNPNITEDIINASLKETFKSWLEQYPTLAEKCPKISITALLKVFAKKFQ